MIVTVTANPALDVTYEVASVRPGEVHRVSAVHERPGGKGLNVASVLAALGEEVVATGLASADFADRVRASGLREELVAVLPSVRRTLAVVEPDRTTGYWEPGVEVPAGGADRLLARVQALVGRARCLVVSGSLPPGVPDSLAADLARAAVEAAVPVVVDTSGEALRLAAAVPGVVLMPNTDELAELTGRESARDAGDTGDPADTADTADLGDLGDLGNTAGVVRSSAALVSAGVRAVVATRGADGLVVTEPHGSWVARPPRPVAGNPTGAGDAAAAAVARGLAGGLPLAEVVGDAVALSAAAVAAPVAGVVDRTTYEELADRVEVRRWEEPR